MARTLTVPVTAAAGQVYAPAATGVPHAVIHNSGPSTVFLGGPGVTPNTGLPLPSKAEVTYPFAPTAIFAVAGSPTLSGTVTTTTSAAITHGASTQVAVAAGGSFTAGMLVQIGAGTSAEVLTVTSGSALAVNFTSKPQLDHASGVTVAQVTNFVASTLKVTAGAS